MQAEDHALSKFKYLQPDKQAEVIDFIEFLLQKQRSTASKPLESSPETDPILRLIGLGAQGVDPDTYVQQLREGWE